VIAAWLATRTAYLITLWTLIGCPVAAIVTLTWRLLLHRRRDNRAFTAFNDAMAAAAEQGTTFAGGLLTVRHDDAYLRWLDSRLTSEGSDRDHS
jgi:hypothetical protein